MNEPKDERFRPALGPQEREETIAANKRKVDERLRKTAAEEIKAAYEPTAEELADIQDKSWTKKIRRDDGLKEAPTPEYVLMIFETNGKIRWTYVNVPIVPVGVLESAGEMAMVLLPIASRSWHEDEMPTEKEG